MNIYLWDSNATDLTGKVLAAQLGAKETREKPKNINNGDVVIGWGTKTKENISLSNTAIILNHPNHIRNARNKFKTLELLAANKDTSKTIPKFIAADKIKDAMKRGTFSFPLIGRTNYHQGGAGLWTVLSAHHLEKALEEGAQYFVEYLPIDDEYRVHVFKGKVIYVQKKVENPTEEGWVAQRKEKIEDYAEKNKVKINWDSVNYALGILAKEAQLLDRIVRSNKRGWKFSHIKIADVPKALIDAAVKSVEVIGLDFGAVDCATAGKNPYIIEVNTGPRLQGGTLEEYVKTFKAFFKDLEKKPEKKEEPIVPKKAKAPEVLEAVEAVPNSKKVGKIALSKDKLSLLLEAANSKEEMKKIIELIMED